MPFPNFDDNLKVIEALPDEPNTAGGLTARALKAKFDQAGLMIQAWINNILIPQLNQSIGLMAGLNALDTSADGLSDDDDHFPTSAAVHAALGQVEAVKLKNDVTLSLENGAEGSVVTDLEGDASINVTSLNPNYMGSPVPLAKGGTGAESAAVARANLGLSDANILGKVYPVGSIYMTMDDRDPSVILGFGTWTRIEDRFLLAAGTRDSGTIGGEASHTLTVNELPSHSHTFSREMHFYEPNGAAYSVNGAAGHTQITSISTDAAGGGQAHNNMPPYIAVNIWRRTA